MSITLEEARALVLQATPILEEVFVPLSEAVGR